MRIALIPTRMNVIGWRTDSRKVVRAMTKGSESMRAAEDRENVNVKVSVKRGNSGGG
jgi:hypothetical protein